MKALVVFESMFGNSERVARAIAAGLEAHTEVVVTDAAIPSRPDLPADIDLLVVGGPTHAFSMTRPSTREDAVRQGAGQGRADRGLREWLEGLGPDLAQLPAATFDTRVSRARRLPGSAARSAARVLRHRSAHLVVKPESFFVDDVSGPLGADEIDRAEQWGRKLAALVQEENRAHAR
jgi:flavodoxin